MFLIVSLLFSGWKTVKIGVVLWGTQQSEELRETFSAFSVNDNGRKKWTTFFPSRSHEGYQSFYSHNSGTFIHLQIICHHRFWWNWFDFHLNGIFSFKQSRFNQFSWFYVKLFWAVVAIHPTSENNGHSSTFPEVSAWLLVYKTRWNVCDAGVRSKWQKWNFLGELGGSWKSQKVSSIQRMTPTSAMISKCSFCRSSTWFRTNANQHCSLYGESMYVQSSSKFSWWICKISCILQGEIQLRAQYKLT